MTRPDGEFSHAGRCELRQNGTSIESIGRWYYAASQSERKNVDIPWQSTWGEVDKDGNVRFDYQIDIEESDHVSAICKLHLQDRHEMFGTYHRLPPFPVQSTITKWGHICFYKLEGRHSKLDRPTGGYDEQGREKIAQK